MGLDKTGPTTLYLHIRIPPSFMLLVASVVALFSGGGSGGHHCCIVILDNWKHILYRVTIIMSLHVHTSEHTQT